MVKKTTTSGHTASGRGVACAWAPREERQSAPMAGQAPRDEPHAAKPSRQAAPTCYESEGYYIGESW